MKTAIVTGASGNMGTAIVLKFLEEGYHVFGTVMKGDKTKIIEHPNFSKVELDLTNETESDRFISTVIDQRGSIDVLIMTVGGFALGSISTTAVNDINKQIQLNFNTTYNVARPTFLQMLKQKQGRIFMTGSRPGLHSSHGTGMIAYSLGKSLLFRLADLMNDEAKGLDVVTNIIVPSTIDTPQNREAMPTANYQDWVTPYEIADIIFYHSSKDAKALREVVIKIYGNA